MHPAEESILFLRNEWSRLGSRPCPACLYEDGRFIRNCKLCEDRHRLRKVLDDALNEIEQLKRRNTEEFDAYMFDRHEAKKAVKAFLAPAPPHGDHGAHHDECGEESGSPGVCDCGVDEAKLKALKEFFGIDSAKEEP